MMTENWQRDPIHNLRLIRKLCNEHDGIDPEGLIKEISAIAGIFLDSLVDCGGSLFDSDIPVRPIVNEPEAFDGAE